MRLCLPFGKAVPDYLVLVDGAHPVRRSFSRTIELVPLETAFGQMIKAEKQTATQFRLLRCALLRAGIVISAESAYRSVSEQRRLLRRLQAEYGEAYAAQTVARPGMSEHHTGLAIDIVPQINGTYLTENADMLNEPAVFSAIFAIAPDYGFILRYPEGKTQITGYAYEPWHIRYVGAVAAKEIHRRQITLEEYLHEKRGDTL